MNLLESCCPCDLARRLLIACQSRWSVPPSTRTQKPLALTHFLPFLKCQALSFLPDSPVSSQPPRVRSACERTLFLKTKQNKKKTTPLLYQQSANDWRECLSLKSLSWQIYHPVPTALSSTVLEGLKGLSHLQKGGHTTLQQAQDLKLECGWAPFLPGRF